MPHWLRTFANAQPVTYVADALRALSHGGPTSSAVIGSIVWSGGVLLVAATLATWRFRRG
jgi:ABC-type multidrug transport system permease subunit